MEKFLSPIKLGICSNCWKKFPDYDDIFFLFLIFAPSDQNFSFKNLCKTLNADFLGKRKNKKIEKNIIVIRIFFPTI